MKEDTAFKKNKGVKNLLDELKKYPPSSDPEILEEDSGSLSLIVDEAIKGADIQETFPNFYARLLADAGLRGRFVEAVRLAGPSQEKKVRGIIERLENGIRSSLEIQSKQVWVTLADLSSIFFPAPLAYRSTAPEEPPIYPLIDTEIDLPPVLYSIHLEGKESEEREDTLLISLFFAVTLNEESSFTALPVELTLNWGGTSKTFSLSEEGQFPLTDVPFCEFLDESRERVTAALEISLARP